MLLKKSLVFAALIPLQVSVAAAESSAVFDHIGDDGSFDVRDYADDTNTELVARGDRIHGTVTNRVGGVRTRIEALGDDITFRVWNDGSDFEGIAIPCRPGHERPDVYSEDERAFDVIGCN